MAVDTQATLRDRREADVIASPSSVHRAWITTLDELEAIPSNVTVLNVKILWRQLGDVHGFTERTERMWLAANPLTGASGGISASRCAWVACLCHEQAPVHRLRGCTGCSVKYYCGAQCQRRSVFKLPRCDRL